MPLIKTLFTSAIQTLSSHLRNLEPMLQEQLILPGKEYANRQLVKAWLSKATEEIMIIDRHLREEGINILYDSLYSSVKGRVKNSGSLLAGQQYLNLPKGDV